MKKSSIKSNFFYSLMYEIFVLFIPIITTPYLTRVLGVKQIGIYSYYFSVSQYFYLFILLGLKNYGSRSISKIRDSQYLLSLNFWNIYALQFFMGIVVNIAYFVYIYFFSNNYYVSFAFMFYIISGFFDFTWFFWGIEKFKTIAIRNSLIKIFNTILIFVFVKHSNDLYLYCLIISCGFLISQISLIPSLINEISFVKPTFKEVKKHLKPNFILFLTVLAVSIFSYMDKIMLGAMKPIEEVGFYEAAQRIIILPTTIIISFGNIMLSRTSHIVSKNNKLINERLLEASIIIAMFISTSISFGIMGISKEFVPLFYGLNYEICISLYLILLPSCICFSFGNVIRTQYLLPNQFDFIYINSAFIGMFVNLLLNLFFIPKFGVKGASAGTLLTEIVVCIYQSYKVKDNIKIKKLVQLGTPFLISGFIMFAIIFNLEYGKSLINTIIIKILLGIFVYFIILTIICWVNKINLNKYFKELDLN